MKKIIILTPSNKICGPVNVAYDIYSSLKESEDVNILSLSDSDDKYIDIIPISLYKLLYLILKDKNRIILHTHGLRPDIVGFISTAFGAKWISTLHIDIYQDMKFNYGYLGVFSSFFWLRILRSSHRLIALNPWLSEKLTRQTKRIVLSIPNGRPEFPKKNHYIDKERINIGFIGNFISLKNVMVIPELLNGHENIKLYIAGIGNQKIEFVKKLDECGIQYYDYGFLRDPTIFYESIDILLLPSLTEAMPLVVLEASSVGIPSILSHLPQYQGLFDNFSTYVKTWKKDEFNEKLNHIINNYEKYSINARKQWEAQFSKSKMAFNYLNQYKELS